MVKETINKLKNISSLTTFNGASEQELAKLMQLLSSSKFPALPREYLDFLKQTDGLIFNDIELYGCQPHKRKDYEFPNIKFIAELTADNDFFRKNIIIGLISEEIIIYNSENRFYAITDRVTLEYLEQYNSLKDLLNFLMPIQSQSSEHSD